MGAHLVDGEFQSDKYPTCPRGKVPLSVKDPTAQDLLWEYAQRRRRVDAEFADDLETALRSAGYEPAAAPRPRASVAAFAIEMERELRANAHKGNRHGWRRDHPSDLLEHLTEEVGELRDVVAARAHVAAVREEAAREAADRMVRRELPLIRERDEARAERDALRAAVAEYLAAVDAKRAAWARSALDYSARIDAVCEAEEALRAALARGDGGAT